jgi:hypothetical protein
MELQARGSARKLIVSLPPDGEYTPSLGILKLYFPTGLCQRMCASVRNVKLRAWPATAVGPVTSLASCRVGVDSD